MTDYVFPYEQQAMRNEELPKGITGLNVLMYYAFCYIYKLYNCGEISKDQGSKYKKQILKAFSDATNILQKYHNMWTRVESISREFKLNKTIENADKFHSAVYNLTE